MGESLDRNGLTPVVSVVSIEVTSFSYPRPPDLTPPGLFPLTPGPLAPESSLCQPNISSPDVLPASHHSCTMLLGYSAQLKGTLGPAIEPPREQMGVGQVKGMNQSMTKLPFTP